MGCGQGDRWSRFQALQDPCCPKIHRQSPDCNQPNTEGEPEEVLQGQEVQAPGSETQEDQSSAPPSQQARGESADQETAEERPPLLHPQICSQSLEAFSIEKLNLCKRQSPGVPFVCF